MDSPEDFVYMPRITNYGITQPSALKLIDCTVIRGAAILSIAFHNYYHRLMVNVLENEMTFDPQRVLAFGSAVIDPRYTIQTLFSFLGHFGVQLFMFLSAYGLAIKHGGAEPPPWAAFVWGRIRKLYPMFLTVVLVWALVTALPHGATGFRHLAENHGVALVLMIFAVSDLVPGYGSPPIGPLWFMPFIVQFYCLWPLLVRLVNRFGKAGLVILAAACFGLTYAVNGTLLSRWHINLLYSPIGHMPELCLGIAAARYGFYPGVTCAIAAVLVFVLANFYAAFWLFSFPAMLIIALWLYAAVRRSISSNALLQYAGALAMPIFLINGPVRRYALLVPYHDNSWLIGLMMGFGSVGTAILLAALLAGAMRYLQERPRAQAQTQSHR